MIEAHLNYFDMVVIGILFLSCLFAFFRGFVREVLSLIAWVGAGAITVCYFPKVFEMLRPHFATQLGTTVSATAILYIGSLVGFAIFNSFIIKILKSGSGIGIFDNLLGLVFGGLRGILIISLGYFMLSIAVKESNRPDWLEKAITRPYIEKSAILLSKIAPTYLSELSTLQTKAVDNFTSEPDAPNATIEVSNSDGGGGKKIQKSFDEIIGNIQNNSKNLGGQQ
jgi:membrane protein required for colicin V production